MGKIKIRPIICLGLFLALLSTLLPGSVPASADEATVVISISPSHSRVGIDEEFWVSVDINDVSQLNSYQFDITYDPTVIRIEGNEGGNAITGGRLTDTSTNPEDITDYPIEWWYTTAGTQGRATISGSLARYLGGSGSGYLANIHFKAVGTYNDTCSITPVKASLKNRLNVDIPVNYTLRGNVEIPYPPITVSIDSPANLQAGGEFAARIIISQVVNLQAFQFEVSYDPDVINIIGEEGGAEGVTPGQIDVSIIDPEMWVYYPIGSPGTVRIISNLPEKSGVSGEGHLVDLHFHVSGSQGQSTPLSLSNISEFKNKLFDPDGNEFSDVTWIDTECQINSLCSIISTSPLPKAEVGLFYQTELEAWGGVLPYQWSIIDGLLPNGLSLDASTGIISGTPTSSDDSCHIIVQVIDNDGNISTKNMEITALAAVEIINAALPDGELGTPYTQRLIANGGLPPYTWEIISGTLPSGLFLNASTGTISGIPTVNASSQEVTFMVTDSKGAFNTKELALNIPDDLVITTNSPLPTGEVGMRYNYQMTSAGGEQPARWSIVTGSLPSGLYLNAATGVISGTPTTAKTSTFICFQATDTAGTSVTKTITLTIMAGPRITTTILPVKEVGAPYMAILGVSGGVAPFIWSIESGTLPEGLTFNSQNGFISGTPTEVTPATAITFGLLDSLGGQATKRLTITIQAPPTIITPSLPDGELGAEYYQVLTARGGVGPYTWTIESGSLPPGLALNANNGVISGTITSNSTYEILLKVTDSVEGCSVRELVLTVMPGPTIITSSLAEGQISINYYQTLEASGGTTPYKWSIIAGSLPRGLVLNPSTGVISGRPVVSVNCQEITFQVTSKLGGTSSKILTITTTGKAEITTSTLSDAETGLPYLQTLTATGGKAPYTWYISPSQLPSGFTLNTSTGVISGITYIRPTRRSLYVKITDSLGGMATRNLSLTVVNGPSIKTTALADGEVGFAYNDNLEVKDGVAPYTWSLIAGDLPSGLTLNQDTGAIWGVPSEASGPVILTFQVTDNMEGTATGDLPLTIHTAPEITTDTLPEGQIKTRYSQTLTVSGGLPPYTWTIQSGTLPSGLSLRRNDGTILGTPRIKCDSTPVTFGITDKLGVRSSRIIEMSVIGGPEITTATLTDAETGLPYLQTLAATGGKAPYTWDISSRQLPAGFILNASTGTISGTTYIRPTIRSLSVKLTDSLGGTDIRNLRLKIVNGPSIKTTALADGEVGFAYNDNLEVKDGVAPYTWSLIAGDLPFGLTLYQDTGEISGVPSETSDQVILTFQVSDSMEGTATIDLLLTIHIAPEITTDVLPEGEARMRYSQTLTVSGGLAPYTWSIQLGRLPSGLSLRRNDGTISGIPRVIGGPTPVAFEVKDKLGVSSLKTIEITIIGGPEITTTTLTDAETGVPYQQTLAATGGKAPYTWDIPSRQMPAGFTLNTSTGTISGTTNMRPTIRSLSVKLTDSLGGTDIRNLRLKIVNGPSIKTTALADGEVGFAYNDNLEVKDGVASYTWSLIAGDLPFGLTLDQDTGEISGVPSEALDQGILTFQVSDSMGGSATGNIPLTIHPAPEITTDSLPQGEVRMRYYQTLTASGGLLPYTWSIQSGTLPSGLSFSRGRGIISGTPRATCGSTPVTFEVKDKLGGTATRILGISVVPAPEITTDIQLADGEIGVAYTQTLFATDGVGPYIWTIISGRLPGGLSLDEDSGVISGTPVQATPGTVINIQATDSVGGYARKSFRMKISAAPKILTFRLAAGKVGGFYQQNLIASGGTGPFTWTIVDGSLPDGLNLDSTAGVISGTPLVQADNILITFMITDSYWMTDIKAISIKIY